MEELFIMAQVHPPPLAKLPHLTTTHQVATTGSPIRLGFPTGELLRTFRFSGPQTSSENP